MLALILYNTSTTILVLPCRLGGIETHDTPPIANETPRHVSNSRTVNAVVEPAEGIDLCIMMQDDRHFRNHACYYRKVEHVQKWIILASKLVRSTLVQVLHTPCVIEEMKTRRALKLTDRNSTIILRRYSGVKHDLTFCPTASSRFVVAR